MKINFLKACTLLALIVAIGVHNRVLAAESISDFVSHIKLEETGEIYVKETIIFNTGGEQKHGIIRNIKNIFTNDGGTMFETPIDLIGVTNQIGQPYKYSVTQSGDEMILKIGDPDKTFSGTSVFVIEYYFTGGVEEFSDHDEIYHNVTGNGWSFPVNKVTATFELPSNFAGTEMDAYCYTGLTGSSQQNCTIYQNKNIFTVSPNHPLAPGEGLTVSISFNKGLINIVPKKEVTSPNTALSQISPESVKYIFPAYLAWLIIPPILIIIYFAKKGRDPNTGISSIPVLFEPPKDNSKRVSPSVAGILEDERVDVRDISATIVDLAIRGHLKIKEEEKDIVLSKSESYKTKDSVSSTLDEFETKLMDIIFGEDQERNITHLSDHRKNELYEYQSSLYKDMVDKGYFPHNPVHVRALWAVLGFVFIMLGSVFAGIISLVLAYFMPRKTLKGARTRIDIMGLRKFLTSQEEQLEFQEKNWYLFEKLLPYAVAFGVTKTWASRFKDLKPLQQTDWYEGRSISNALIFNNITNTLNSGISAAVTPIRSSSGFSSGSFGGGGGGGFSGGGFSGGGGGGSW